MSRTQNEILESREVGQVELGRSSSRLRIGAAYVDGPYFVRAIGNE